MPLPLIFTTGLVIGFVAVWIIVFIALGPKKFLEMVDYLLYRIFHG